MKDSEQDKFRLWRKRGVPLAAIETPDPAATVEGILSSLNGDREKVFVAEWNSVEGTKPLNDVTKDMMAPPAEGEAALLSGDETEVLRELKAVAKQLTVKVEVNGEKKKRGPILIMHNAHVCFRNANNATGANFVQAVSNLRDTLKQEAGMLVMLGPVLSLPLELRNDIVLHTVEYPDAAEVKSIMVSVVKAAGMKPAVVEDKHVDAMLGLPPFSVEQNTALALVEGGIDPVTLWGHKRKTVEQTQGLSVYRGADTFDDIGGHENLKGYFRKIIKGIRAVGFIDEVEKSLSTGGGDRDGGVSADQLRTTLTEIQDGNIPCIMLIGPGGTGKSQIVKCLAGYGPEIYSIDFGATMNSLVGESQHNIRAMFKTFRAVAAGKALIVMTCNRIAALPPELRRRCNLGTFFVDLPGKDERELIWPIHMKKLGIKKQDLPDDTYWTGAEIRSCCEVSFRTGMTLKEASLYVVPIAVSAHDQIEMLRRGANGRYISSNKPGIYKMQDEAAGSGRAVIV